MNEMEPEPLSVSELDALQQRVRKLEESVESLRDTGLLENRIVERLRVREEVPVAARTVAPVPPPEAAAPLPAEPIRQLPPPVSPAASVKPAWLLFEMIGDFKNMMAMLFDMRFRLGWTTRVAAIVILCVMMTGDYWLVPFSSIPFAMKILNLILAFVLFKIVNWETRRYVAQRR